MFGKKKKNDAELENLCVTCEQHVRYGGSTQCYGCGVIGDLVIRAGAAEAREQEQWRYRIVGGTIDDANNQINRLALLGWEVDHIAAEPQTDGAKEPLVQVIMTNTNWSRERHETARAETERKRLELMEAKLKDPRRE